MPENTTHLQFTQFYKSEAQSPPDCSEPNLWYYEMIWAENPQERAENHERVQEYKKDVLPLYHEEDGIPLSLKALLYNRYTHWLGGYSLESDVQNFVKFLNQRYLRKDERIR